MQADKAPVTTETIRTVNGSRHRWTMRHRHDDDVEVSRVAVADVGDKTATGRSSPPEQLRADGGTPSPVPADLIVVSNRQPYRHERDDDGTVVVRKPTGGLTAGLDPVMRTTGGTWVAWGDGDADREVTDDDGRVAVPPNTADQYTLHRVWLSEAAVEGHYTGYSNRVLWPLCHDLPEHLECRDGDREWYRRVNRAFADATLEHVDAHSVVWLQDYHLGLAPAMIRDDAPTGATLAQFWHIPWPTPETFGTCPNARELLDGLLGNDVLGFHTAEDVTDFLACVNTFLEGATVDHGTRSASYRGRETRVVATPMGVDAAAHAAEAEAGDGDCWRRLCDRYELPGDTPIVLGVDRLDYTKGIPERLAALERLFEIVPEWRESVTLLQKATPSRREIPAYAAFGERVRGHVDRINDRFGTADWTPVVYTEDFLTESDLATCYRHADVLVVSSLADGMNLVAQEYVAASIDGEGALVLSEAAGAAEGLGYPAYTVDPTDTDALASAIIDALEAPQGERRSRMAALRERVFERDLEWWMTEQFRHMGAVDETGNETEPRSDLFDPV